MAGSSKKTSKRPKTSSQPDARSPPPGDVPIPVPPLAHHFVTQFFRLLVKIVQGATDWRTLLIMTGAFLGWVALLPEERRHEASLNQLAHTVLGSQTQLLLTVGGYVLLGLVLLVGGPWAVMARRRIKSQGDELARLRQQGGPERASSRDPSILDGAKAKVRVDLPPKAPGSKSTAESVEAEAPAKAEAKAKQ